LRCRVGGRSEVPDEEWLRSCTCPGSRQRREDELQVNQDTEQRVARDAEVFHDLDVGSGRTAREIQQQILDAYAACGYVAPSDFSRVSRFIAAGTGHRGTRTFRLLAEGLRGLRAAYNRIPAAPAQNERELGRMVRALLHLLRPFAVHAILAAGAALGAYFASGILRVILIVLAVLLSAIIAWGVLLAVGGITLLRVLKRWPDHH
jgi:hypothetical protein